MFDRSSIDFDRFRELRPPDPPLGSATLLVWRFWEVWRVCYWARPPHAERPWTSVDLNWFHGSVLTVRFPLPVWRRRFVVTVMFARFATKRLTVRWVDSEGGSIYGSRTGSRPIHEPVRKIRFDVHCSVSRFGLPGSPHLTASFPGPTANLIDPTASMQDPAAFSRIPNDRS